MFSKIYDLTSHRELASVIVLGIIPPVLQALSPLILLLVTAGI